MLIELPCIIGCDFKSDELDYGRYSRTINRLQQTYHWDHKILAENLEELNLNLSEELKNNLEAKYSIEVIAIRNH